MDLKTVEGVRKLMASSKTEDEWNENTDKVKAANSGYPSFWYSEIVLSGLMTQTAGKFNNDAKIHIWAGG